MNSENPSTYSNAQTKRLEEDITEIRRGVARLTTDIPWQIIDQCSNVVMPFGKYKDVCLLDIPLRYLDETVCVMPPTWIVRVVIRLVDEAMSHPLAGNAPGRESFNDIENEWQKIFEQKSKACQPHTSPPSPPTTP